MVGDRQTVGGKMNIEEQFTVLCDDLRQSIIDKRHDGTYTADEANQLLLMVQSRFDLTVEDEDNSGSLLKRTSRGWRSSSWCGDFNDY